MIEDITAPQPYLKPFPAFADVFDVPLELHRKHFLPLISVDASVVYPDLELWLHFVTPIEPLLEQDVGSFTKDHHDFYNKEGQYAFNVTNGKYAFAGEFAYFAYESGEIFRAFPNWTMRFTRTIGGEFPHMKKADEGFKYTGDCPIPPKPRMIRAVGAGPWSPSLAESRCLLTRMGRPSP